MLCCQKTCCAGYELARCNKLLADVAKPLPPPQKGAQDALRGASGAAASSSRVASEAGAGAGGWGPQMGASMGGFAAGPAFGAAMASEGSSVLGTAKNPVVMTFVSLVFVSYHVCSMHQGHQCGVSYD